MKVVINYQEYADVEVEKSIIAEGVPSVEIVESCTVDPDKFVRDAQGAEAAIFQYVPITREVIDALSSCRGYVRYGIGYNNIDADYAASRGRWVANVPHYCLDEVSNHALAMILALNRKLLPTDNLVRSNDYALEAVRPIRRLRDCVVGIVGMGAIGRLLADKVRPLVRRVLIHDPCVKDYAGCEWAELAKVCAEADYLSLHVPLLPETRNLVGAGLLASMKPSACIVNTGRGGTLDERALAHLISRGQLGGAGLDVYGVEPLPEDSPLRYLDNVILTSHNAWYSEGAILELKQTAARQVVQILRREQPAHAVGICKQTPDDDVLGVAQ